MRGVLLFLAITSTAVTTLQGCDEIDINTGGDTRGTKHHYSVGGGIDRLVVRADAGTITIRHNEKENTRNHLDAPTIVTERLHYDDQAPETSHERDDDGTLTLTATCPVAGQQRCWVDYVIEVGSDRVDVVAETDAGDIVVESRIARLEATTDAGDIRATKLGGPAVARAGAGNVTLTFRRAPQRIDARSETGDVTVRLPEGFAYAVDAQTDLGDRKVEVGTSSDSEFSVFARTNVGDVAVLTAG